MPRSWLYSVAYAALLCCCCCRAAPVESGQEFREYVRPNAAPAPPSATYTYSYADQLTRNRHGPGAPAPLTEEMRNRMAALRGIQRVNEDYERRPHPEFHQRDRAASAPTTPALFLTNDGGESRQFDNDLSQVVAVTETAENASWTPYGQDLTEQSSRKEDAFAARNLLFAKGMHGSGTGDIDALETRQSEWQYVNYENFAYTNRPSPPRQPNGGALTAIDRHSVPSAAAAFEASVADGQSTQAPNAFPRSPLSDALDDFKALLANTRPPPAPNSGPVAVVGEFQSQAAHLPQQPMPVEAGQPLPVGNQQVAFSVRGIDRFDTHLSRFATADPSRPGQVVLNPLDPILRGAVTVDDYMKRPTALLTGDRTPTPIDYPPFVDMSTGGSVPDLRLSSETPSSEAFSAGTRILTNPHVGGQWSAAAGDRAATSSAQGTTTAASPRNFTTYPDFRADLFPPLANHVNEDPRPATGRRLGPQQRFGGGTNELKEDVGQRNAINDRRPPWAHPSGMGGVLSATARPSDTPALNQFASSVVIKSVPQSPPSYTVGGGTAWRRIGDDLSVSDQLGHIQYGRLTNAELTTRVPHQFGPETTTVIAVPLPSSRRDANIRGEEVGPASRMIGSGFSPISAKIVLVPSEEKSIMPRGYIREYHGPEEVTGSRYRNLHEHFNAGRNPGQGGGAPRYVKMELLNE